MMVVVIIGILGILANYGVHKYVATAKAAEARNALGQMVKDAVTAYERESGDLSIIAKGALSSTSRKLCPSSSTSVPSAIASVTAHKYQSKASDWTVDRATKSGFYCLKFSMEEPQYYMYSYTVTPGRSPPGGFGSPAPGDTFVASAQGDLDGNGITSLFTIQGQINADAINTSPQILEVRPDE